MARSVYSTLWLILASAFIFTVAINLLHHKLTNERLSPLPPKALANLKSNFLAKKTKRNVDASSQTSDGSVSTMTSNKKSNEQISIKQGSVASREMGENPKHRLAGLSCDSYGGPSDDLAEEMVYWSDIDSDSKYVSPFKQDGEEKYLTFEPDGGGWNNVRMAMETVVSMAHAMGRTLVVPPAQGMYLLRKDKGKQRTHFSFADFFHLDSLDAEHEGLKIITTEEFLNQMAMTGKLVNVTSGEVSFPPGNRTDWNGEEMTELKEYLRSVTHVRNWKPGNCIAAFPSSSNPDDITALHNMMEEITNEKPKPNPTDFVGKPVSVDAPAKDRLREMLANREELCIYDEEMQKAPVVHFMCYHKQRARLLTHFYSFLFFEDWRQDLWTKRFVRDHLRYLDELQCAAARVMYAVRERARAKNPQGNPDGLYDSFHIRRGDFQFKRTRVEADVIYENSKDELEEGATVYISTDERKKEFFKSLADHYDICFLDDFKHLFEGLNTNYYGMLDQLIASKGRVFFGTWHSTFTGYINRMRGYYVSKHKLEGYEDGTMDSYYFIPKDLKNAMRTYQPVHKAFFNREFPTAWRDLDKGINELTLDTK